VAGEAFTPAGLMAATLLLTACAASDPSPRTTSQPAADSGWSALDPASLTVTSGEITRLSATRFETSSGSLRAQLAGSDPGAAELRFRFRGPTGEGHEMPLSSGELRRQIGIKLRAQDGCNVVYAMWRIEPTRGLNISVKSNPGKHESSVCGDAGYTQLEARELHEVQVIETDSEHTLRAGISGTDFKVYADGKLSWAGKLPAEAFDFDGPVGIRSDNGVFDMEFRISRSTRMLDAARP
jgi:hypothetical protein